MVLYLTYDGVLEPLGKSQVLAYLRLLAKDRAIHLLSFEKANDLARVSEVYTLKQELNTCGITWYPLRYHKHPSLLATSWDVLVGSAVGLSIALRNKVVIIHARGYVSSIMALVVRRFTGAAFLFDMRGFWADEKLEGGWSNTGLLYKIAKYYEQRFFLAADHIVSLTEVAVQIIRDFPYLRGRIPPVTVIPTCTDMSKFNILEGQVKPSSLTIGYVGTATSWYSFDQTAECFARLSRINPEVKFLIVNRGEHDFIRAKLKVAGVPLESVDMRSASYEEMPRLIAGMHASIFFIKPVFSKQASSPTKLAELLSCGVPCITNSGVGDVEKIFENERIGVILRSFEYNAINEALIELLALVSDPHTTSRCVAVAKKHFSLQGGVERYKRIYKSLELRRM